MNLSHTSLIRSLCNGTGVPYPRHRILVGIFLPVTVSLVIFLFPPELALAAQHDGDATQSEQTDEAEQTNEESPSNGDISTPSQDAACTLTVEVVAAEDRKPIEGALVLVRGSGPEQKGLTNSQGIAKIVDVSLGHLSIQAVAGSFRSNNLPVNLTASCEAVQITLEPITPPD